MSAISEIYNPQEWEQVPFGRLVVRTKVSGYPELDPLSVFLDQGVVPRSSREDNHNRLGEDLSKYLLVEPGDIVFNKLRTWQGGLGVSNYTGIVSPAYFVCRPIQAVKPRFLHYLLRSSVYLQELTRISKWMPPSQFDISWEQLRCLPILLPSVNEQRKVVDFLDVETARIEALISKKCRLIELLIEYVDSIVLDGVSGNLTSPDSFLKHSGVDWLGDIPRHFETPWLGAFHTTQLGKMLSVEAATGPDQYPYIKNTNVRWDHFDLEDLPTMTFDASDRQRCSLRSGDVLVCEGGEVGRSAVWDHDSEIFFQKALHRVRPLGENVPRYLMYCLWAAAKLRVFEVEGNQATIVHLTGEKLREHRFPWPPLEEQRQIVELIDAQRKRIDQITESLRKQMELLIERRQALVTDVVTGQKQVAALGI